MVTEHSRFQLEATKLERTVVFQVTAVARTDRGRTRLSAETQCSDPQNFLLQFIVRDATDFDDLLARFRQALDHRGFVPVRYRLREENGAWSDWIALGPVAAA
jgi:hypothetical protein